MRATVAGQGPEGYRRALARLREELDGERRTREATRRTAARARSARRSCDAREVDGLLVSTPVNLRYLTGYTGTTGSR